MDTDRTPPADARQLLLEAIDLAVGNAAVDGGPFGAVVVTADGRRFSGVNRVTADNDPTAHAEVMAIRSACRALGTFDLSGAVLYTSCEPCPMCLAAVYWARIPALYYGNTRADAAAIGFDDDFIYEQMPLPPEKRSVAMKSLLRDEAQRAFREWEAKPDKVKY